jgi:hypothetical protein
MPGDMDLVPNKKVHVRPAPPPAPEQVAIISPLLGTTELAHSTQGLQCMHAPICTWVRRHVHGLDGTCCAQDI